MSLTSYRAAPPRVPEAGDILPQILIPARGFPGGSGFSVLGFENAGEQFEPAIPPQRNHEPDELPGCSTPRSRSGRYIAANSDSRKWFSGWRWIFCFGV